MRKPTAKAKAPKPVTLAPDQKYMVEDAMRTLVRGHEIMADPKLHAAVKTHAAGQAQHMKKIARGAKL